jgi:cation:H+ antiporter
MIGDLATPLLFGLLVSSGVVVVAGGSSLARTGDQIAEHTGLGRVFVGALFIAVATSLPELGTAVTAAARNAPDLAIGDLFGSSMANMAILAVIDLRYRHRIIPAVELGHTRVAAVAIGLTAVAVMAITTPSGVSVGGVGVASLGLAAVYLASLAWFRKVPAIGIAVADPKPFRAARPAKASAPTTAKGVAGRFALATAALLVATPLLTISTESIGERFGISQGALGITVLAIATSLPELATSVAAVRLGAPDLAVGNLLGSNAANMAIILVVDVFYRPGPVLGAVNDSLAVAGTGAILLMSLAIASIASGRANRAQRFEPDSAVLLVAYVAALVAVAAATA